MLGARQVKGNSRSPLRSLRRYWLFIFAAASLFATVAVLERRSETFQLVHSKLDRGDAVGGEASQARPDIPKVDPAKAAAQVNCNTHTHTHTLSLSLSLFLPLSI